MWPVTAFSVARGNIQEKSLILKFPPTITVNINAEASNPAQESCVAPYPEAFSFVNFT